MNIRSKLVKVFKSIPVLDKVFAYYHYHAQLKIALSDCQSILDLGCGADSPFAAFSKEVYSVGIDLDLPSIENSKRLNSHNEYFAMDVMDIDQKFQDKSFDCVLMGDLIEHLEKEQGELLLQKAEKIARKKIVIFTPNGFVPQGIHFDNPWQVHKSGWTAAEMKARGFEVIGFGGFKFIKGEWGEPIIWPKFFWRIIGELSQVMVRDIPTWAFSILCIKKLD